MTESQKMFKRPRRMNRHYALVIVQKLVKRKKRGRMKVEAFESK